MAISRIKNIFLNFKIPDGRGDISKVSAFKKNFYLIDESYNANPLSMKSAIKNMNSYIIKKNQRKLILLTDMLEIGKKSKKFHRELSNIINKTIAYEKASFIEYTGSDWYESSGLVGDPSATGNSAIITNEYIENIKDLSGISSKKPVISLCLAILMFSMVGIPPFSGFFGKFYICVAALRADLM